MSQPVLRKVRADDWIHVPEVEKSSGQEEDIVLGAAARFLDRLTAGLYEDSAYARGFWILGTLCILVEPFLIVYSMNDSTFAVQLILFVISTWLFIMQTVALLFFQKPWRVVMRKVLASRAMFQKCCINSDHIGYEEELADAMELDWTMDDPE